MAEAKVLKSRQAYEGLIIGVGIETVELPNGNVADLEIVRHPGAAAVVPVLGDGRAILVRQYRHATRDWLLEVPAGKLDPGETPEACAHREVEEETGFRVGMLAPLGSIWTSPGFTDERIWLFVASDLEPTKQSLQSDEVLSVERLALPQAVAMARRGEISDAKSVCTLLRAAEHLGLGGA